MLGYEMVRPATAKEKAIYYKVNEIANALDDNDFDTLMTLLTDFVDADGRGAKIRAKTAIALRKFISRYGLTTAECEIWYYIEEV